MTNFSHPFTIGIFFLIIPHQTAKFRRELVRATYIIVMLKLLSQVNSECMHSFPRHTRRDRVSSSLKVKCGNSLLEINFCYMYVINAGEHRICISGNYMYLMPYTYIFMLKHLVCLTHKTQVVNIQSTSFIVDGDMVVVVVQYVVTWNGRPQ